MENSGNMASLEDMETFGRESFHNESLDVDGSDADSLDVDGSDTDSLDVDGSDADSLDVDSSNADSLDVNSDSFELWESDLVRNHQTNDCESNGVLFHNFVKKCNNAILQIIKNSGILWYQTDVNAVKWMIHDYFNLFTKSELIDSLRINYPNCSERDMDGLLFLYALDSRWKENANHDELFEKFWSKLLGSYPSIEKYKDVVKEALETSGLKCKEMKLKDTIGPNDNICAICLEEENVWIELQCKHKYHKKCAEKWLQLKKQCPTCRQEQ